MKLAHLDKSKEFKLFDTKFIRMSLGIYADQRIRRLQRLGTFRHVIVKSLPSYTAIASDHQTDDRPI